MSAELLHVVGVDPGPLPGIVSLRFRDNRLCDVEVAQATPRTAMLLLAPLLEHDDWPTLVQAEQFVVGRRAAHSGTASAGRATRELIGALRERWPFVIIRTASQVKPWATDRRLAELRTGGQNLIEATKGMRHARDAARHALYAAVHDGGIPDPLSKRSN